jgi:hypothetical protein
MGAAQGMDRDVAAIEGVREAVGPECAVLADANNYRDGLATTQRPAWPYLVRVAAQEAIFCFRWLPRSWGGAVAPACRSTVAVRERWT